MTELTCCCCSLTRRFACRWRKSVLVRKLRKREQRKRQSSKNPLLPLKTRSQRRQRNLYVVVDNEAPVLTNQWKRCT